MFRVFMAVLAFISIFSIQPRPVSAAGLDSPRFWQVQSIDTMKFSRDPSREFLGKLDETAKIVDFQVRQIADTGATHVAIATPYDEEFLPILKLWVEATRRNNLKVWFRGNWSGWEGWFGYPRMNRTEHLDKTKTFIVSHPDLFENGDVFTACPECENGGPGDPRMHTDPAGFTKFLLEEHQIVETAFVEIDKQVITNFYSSNGDVARLIMTPETTKALGGVVTVDHYVSDTERLARELIQYAQNSQGKVVLGEFGAPIPDLHGNMTPEQQASWLDDLFSKLVQNPDLIGLNYWTNVGGSTALWDDHGNAKPAVDVIKKYYQPETVSVSVKTITNQPITHITAQIAHHTFTSDTTTIEIPYLDNQQRVRFSAPGYLSTEVSVAQLQADPNVILPWEPKPFIPSLIERVKWFFRRLLPFLK